MKLNWIKCQSEVWCKLNSVNLKHEHFNNLSGVYMIWHGGQTPAVVYIGQGEIKDRIAEHRQNPDIQSFKPQGLYVTWASVNQNARNGVEAYLAHIWRPKVGSNHPVAAHIEVNSPWD